MLNKIYEWFFDTSRVVFNLNWAETRSDGNPAKLPIWSNYLKNKHYLFIFRNIFLQNLLAYKILRNDFSFFNRRNCKKNSKGELISLFDSCSSLASWAYSTRYRFSGRWSNFRYLFKNSVGSSNQAFCKAWPPEVEICLQKRVKSRQVRLIASKAVFSVKQSVVNQLESLAHQWSLPSRLMYGRTNMRSTTGADVLHFSAPCMWSQLTRPFWKVKRYIANASCRRPTRFW